LGDRRTKAAIVYHPEAGKTRRLTVDRRAGPAYGSAQGLPEAGQEGER